MSRICEVEGCERPVQKKKRLCGRHLATHDPVPEHHVAAERTCLRCQRTFASTWAGDRTCPPCREQLHRAELEGRKRGHTPVHYDSAFEPHETPSVL